MRDRHWASENRFTHGISRSRLNGHVRLWEVAIHMIV